MLGPEQLEQAIKASAHQQAQMLEQAAKRLSDLAEMIATSRDAVAQSAALSEDAKACAAVGTQALAALEQGLASLTELVAGLPRFVERMRQIEKECHVIDKLSFHSHLLALNASVESARLGKEAGAFSVIADGMRDLAAQSRTVADRIESAVAAGAGQIEEFEGLAAETLAQNRQAEDRCRSALGQMGGAVERIAESTGEVLQSADAQTRATNQVSEELRTQMEDGSRRTSEVIGLLTGRIIQDLTPEESRRRLDEFVLVDVRRPDEFCGELGHIRGATLVTLSDRFAEQLRRFDPVMRYLFVCRSGGRSARAARIAQEVGLQRVFNMTGGMLRWNSLGYPTTKAAA